MSESLPVDYKYKIMILGESQIGKTALINRYSKNSFGLGYITTVGIDFQIKFISLKGKNIKLQIWDTAGQERFRNITKSYFQTSNGFVMAYDITSTSSFESVVEWLKQIEENASEEAKIILVGTKCDLESQRQVSFEQGKELADEKGLKFFETSSKDDINVVEAFEELALELLSEEERGPSTNSQEARESLTINRESAKNEEEGEEEKKKCCS